ncbi:DNA protecting protein DprA [Paucilactobacillus oligofermentans DSM 15707 = LMG 22743]|uniref:DNA protecting protein DprA n=1 Tax=Paucilactobacillus oligofermentans DSM 15707 = LMG 22743 TaxID=1423778 RepID=A0A0R1RND6_9LACO|nr:DNA-processing protein DprA [Paucilactobacillus oligofermentans]KRL54840.1 DNA protecting protein DprA [Paucilactobacillus oligofermentans DSM 15707 = LMG 22743]CUS26245.1 DNA protecting protein DprA [Paucilactobacillus oligofermentans DSM 15707 = LMG 22743]
MLKKLFLLKIHLCKGIGMMTEQKLFIAFKYSLYNTSILECCQLAGLSVKITEKILTNWNTQELADDVQRHWLECQFITILDDDYPEQLKEIYCSPIVIFYRGKKELLNTKILGVVGARKSTTYGKQVLNEILPSIVDKSITIVSGLATGIDGISHQITLNNDGNTIGVIGTGIDIVYPRMHQNLQSQMECEGLVISEYPLGTQPYRSHFPERNRIIAGLSETLLVVEAKTKSGSLITANLALQENRNVCAIPGKITDPFSSGCNELIAAGAKPILSVNDVLNEFLI